MNRVLEEIMTELNPLHDFDNIRFHNHVNTDSLAGKAKAQLKNLSFLLTSVKPFARGGVVGGIVGAFGNYIAGNSPGDGFVNGAFIGASLDFEQYMLRGLYYYAKKQFNPFD